jgi:hypothetical protein
MKKFGKVIQQILSGGILTHPKVRRYYSFLLFIFALALLWIGNTYTYMHTWRKVEIVKKSLSDSTAILQKMEIEFTNKSKPSQLLEKLKQDKDRADIKMAHNAVYKIVVDEKEQEGGEE